MEKIVFDKHTSIWKTKLNLNNDLEDILKICKDIVEKNEDNSIFDNYAYIKQTKSNFKKNDIFITNPQNKLDCIINIAINKCIELYDSYFNSISIDPWVNVVRSKNPKQHQIIEGDLEMHNHTDINKKTNNFIPTYTWVYYIQMPNNLEGDDGVLYIETIDKKLHAILPKEDDLIIFKANISHGPNSAHKSTKNRIVLAGNVGFEYIKDKKTLL